MTISFSGLASGLDTSSWVESLVALKQAKVTELEEEKDLVTTTREALSNIKSFFTSFRSVLEKVTDTKFNVGSMDIFAQNLATSSNAAVLSAIATAEAAEASYEISVDKLATQTQAVSGHKYTTSIVSTTMATSDTKLINLGVKAGNIGVNVNGVEVGVTITENDTIQTFIDKLKNIGVNASFNNETGIFNANLSVNDINDKDGTGIVQALHLEGVNEGYQSGQLQVTDSETTFSPAEESTLLKDLGVKAGTLTIEANDAVYNVEIDEATTLGELIQALRDENISATLDEDGTFRLEDAVITNDGTTNLIDAFGLKQEVNNNVQQSGDLSYKTVVTEVTEATLDTLLNDIVEAGVKDGDTVIVKNSDNEISTIQLTSTSTLGDLFDGLKSAGLNAELNNDGTVTISGGIITGGSLDIVDEFGLTSSPLSGIVTGNPLTETIVNEEIASSNTKLVEDLGVKAGYLQVTNSNGGVYYEKISEGMTIGDLINDYAAMGISASIDADTGVLTITGGTFTALSDSEVQNLVNTGAISETNPDLIQGTDLLSKLYGADNIPADHITPGSAHSKSESLKYEVTGTVEATLTTTLHGLGLADGDSTATFETSEGTIDVTLNSDMTIQDMIDYLDSKGITASFDETTSKLTINGARLLSSSTSEAGVTVNIPSTESHTADGNSRIGDIIGLNNDSVLRVYDSTGKTIGSVTVNGDTTINSMIQSLSNYGINGSISNGILTLDGENGNYVTGSVLSSMGISNTTINSVVTSATTVSEEPLFSTVLVTVTADENSTLGEILNIDRFSPTGQYTITGTIQSDGSITGGSVVAISSAEDLIAMASSSNSYSGYTFVLTNDITIESTSDTWIGIGNSGFAGTFDGLGHNIEFNVTIDVSSSMATGLFAKVSYGTVRNVSTSGTMTLKDGSFGYIGGIVGSLEGGLVENVESSVTLDTRSNDDSQRPSYVGGLIGNLSSGTLKNSEFNGELLTGAGAYGTGDYVGNNNNYNMVIDGTAGTYNGVIDGIVTTYTNWGAESVKITLSVDTTVQEMIDIFADNNITASISNGVISIDSSVKIEGSILEALGIDSTVTYSTSNLLVEYTSVAVSGVTGMNNTISDVVNLGTEIEDLSGMINASITSTGSIAIYNSPSYGTYVAISSEADLKAMKGKSYTGVNFVLTKDLKLTDSDWEGFNITNGVFEGGGHNIELDIAAPSAGALFNSLSASTIRNLSTSGTVVSSGSASGMVGLLRNHSALENVSSSAVINAEQDAGGLVANISSSGVINNADFFGVINAKTSAGGIVGFASSGSTVQISDTLFSGTINMLASDTSTVRAGGTIGYGYNILGSISNVFYTGSINTSAASASANIFEGAIFGFYNSTTTTTALGTILKKAAILDESQTLSPVGNSTTQLTNVAITYDMETFVKVAHSFLTTASSYNFAYDIQNPDAGFRRIPVNARLIGVYDAMDNLVDYVTIHDDTTFSYFTNKNTAPGFIIAGSNGYIGYDVGDLKHYGAGGFMDYIGMEMTFKSRKIDDVEYTDSGMKTYQTQKYITEDSLWTDIKDYGKSSYEEDYAFHIMTSDGVMYTINTQNRTIGEVFDELEAYGVSGSIENGKLKFVVDDGIDFTYMNALVTAGVIFEDSETSSTIGVTTMQPSDKLSEAEEIIPASGSTKLSEVINISGNELITVYNRSGSKTGTVTVNSDTTFDQLKSSLSNYGITMTLNDGVLKLSSSAGSYAQGDPLKELGIVMGPDSAIEEVFGFTNVISGKYTTSDPLYSATTGEVVVTEDTTLGDIGFTGEEWFTIDATSTTMLAESTEFGTLISWINSHSGAHASLEDGVFKIEGVTLSNAQFEALTGLHPTVDSSGSAGIVGGITTATEDSRIADIVLAMNPDEPINNSYTLKMTGKFTITVDCTTTIEELVNILNSNGVTASFTDGKLNISGVSALNTLSGTLADALGISAITTTTSVSLTSTVLASSTGTQYASMDNTFSELGVSPGAYTIMDANGDYVATKTALASDTLQDFFDDLEANGIYAQLSTDGRITLTSPDGRYITGIFAENLGIGKTYSYNDKVFGYQYSTTPIMVTTTELANSSDLLSDFLSTPDKTTFRVVSSSGSTVANITLKGTETIADFLDILGKYGIEGDMVDGMITLDSTNGNRIEGDVATALGFGNIQYTIQSSSTVTYSKPATANSNTTLGELAGGRMEQIENDIPAATHSINSSGTLVKISGSSSSGTIVHLSTTSQLASMVGKTYTGVEFYLTKDISLSSSGWSGINLNNSDFNGNGHVIKLSGLTTQGGLFGSVTNSSTISDLVVTGSFNRTTTSSRTYIGGIVDYLKNSTVEDSVFGGTLKVSGSSVTYMAGVVGYINQGTIQRSEFSGYLSYSYTSSGTRYIGGIVGQTSTASGNTVKDNMTLSSDIWVTASSSTTYVGGIVGYLYGGSGTTVTNNLSLYGGSAGTYNGALFAHSNSSAAQADISGNIVYSTISMVGTGVADAVESGVLSRNTSTNSDYISPAQRYGWDTSVWNLEGGMPVLRRNWGDGDNHYVDLYTGNKYKGRITLNSDDTITDMNNAIAPIAGASYYAQNDYVADLLNANAYFLSGTSFRTNYNLSSISYYEETPVEMSTTASQLGLSGKTITVVSSLGEVVGTIRPSSADTLGDIFEDLEAYGITGRLENGKVILESAGNSVIGPILSVLNLDKINSNSYTIGQMTSTGKITYTTESPVNGDTTLGEIAGEWTDLGADIPAATHSINSSGTLVKISGSSSSGTIVHISTSAQLAAMQGKTYSGVEFYLTKDITITDSSWTGINLRNSTFSGNGHVVTLNSNNSGLFNTVTSQSTISDLVVKGQITRSTTTTTTTNAGGIVGYLANSTVSNCISAVEMAILSSVTTSYTGGIVGYSAGGTIENSEFSGSVVSLSNGNANQWLGGIAGYASSSYIKGNAVLGTVIMGYGNGHYFAGGISGAMMGSSQVEDNLIMSNLQSTSAKTFGYELAGTGLGGLTGAIAGSLQISSTTTIEGNIAVGVSSPYSSAVGYVLGSSTLPSSNNRISTAGFDTSAKSYANTWGWDATGWDMTGAIPLQDRAWGDGDKLYVDTYTTVDGAMTYSGRVTLTSDMTLDEFMTATASRWCCSVCGNRVESSYDDLGNCVMCKTDSWIISNSASNVIRNSQLEAILGMASVSSGDIAFNQSADVSGLSSLVSATITSDTTLTSVVGTTTAKRVFNISNYDGDNIATVTMSSTATVQDLIDTLADYGIDATLFSGTFSAGSRNGLLMKGALADALGIRSTYSESIQFKTPPTTSRPLYKTVETAITEDTLLSEIDPDFKGGLYEYISHMLNTSTGDIYSTSTRNNITLADDATVGDLINALAAKAISTSIGADGRLHIQSNVAALNSIINALPDDSPLKDLFHLGDLETGAMHKGEYFNTVSTKKLTVQKKSVDSMTLADLGIDGRSTINISYTETDGSTGSVSATFYSDSTIVDVIDKLTELGLEVSTGTSTITIKGSNWQQMEISGSLADKLFTVKNYNYSTAFDRYESDELEVEIPPEMESDRLVVTTGGSETVSMSTKLSDLVDSSGNNLGITAGQIYVYKDGVRNIVNISADDTLESLSNKLSPYNISIGLGSDNKLYFNGNGNSYMTTDGLTSNVSNILDKLGIDGNWSTTYDTVSKPLVDNQTGESVATGDAKLVDLLDSNGSLLGITAGTYYIYENGVRTTATITENTTVADFLAELNMHGISANIGSDGSISLGGQNNSYITSSNLGNDSNIVDVLFPDWQYVNTYTSDPLLAHSESVQNITLDTKLADIDGVNYEEGYITVNNNGVKTNILLTADETIGTLINKLSVQGFDAAIDQNGSLIIKSQGGLTLEDYTGSGNASNALEILGIDSANWINTNIYESSNINEVEISTIDTAVTRDTKLSELGITSGEYYIYNNGVRYTAMVSVDDTLDSFIQTLATFGIQASLIQDGDKSVLKLLGNGDSYIAKSNSATSASNIVDKLFPNDKESSYNYTGALTQTITTTSTDNINEDTLLSKLDSDWGGSKLKSEGSLVFNVNGETRAVVIEADDTIGDLITKLDAVGISASVKDGIFTIQSGFDELSINSAVSTSNLMTNLGLTFHDDMGGYSASSDTVMATTTIYEERTRSAANYADDSTKLSDVNISSGSLSIFKDGQKSVIQVDAEETFGELRTRVNASVSGVDLKFENGILTFFATDGSSFEIGTTTDTSNLTGVAGLTKQEDGTVASSREMYKVNQNSVLTQSGLFTLGDVTEGTFTIGNAVFTINKDTTMNSLISQINSSEDSNATAYWDSIDGRLVITSRATGESLINIEAGTSNFTDIMGFTTSETKADGSVIKRLAVDNQTLGSNASFTINGTRYTSTSNTVTSDISRIEGVTLNLKDVTESGTVTLTIEKDKEVVADAIEDVINAYNELMSNVNDAISIEGDLHSETTLKLIRTQLRNLMTGSGFANATFRNLDSIGISFEAASGTNVDTENIDTLYFDKEKFLEAYAESPSDMKDFLVGDEAHPGVLSKVEELIESTLASVTGYFDSADNSFETKIKRIDDQISRQTRAVERYRIQLESKFQSMDMLIANMQNQYSSFLSL